MNTSFAVYATLVVVVMVGLLLLRGFVTIAPERVDTGFLEPNNVKGMELVYKGQPYTLNFEQQQQAIDLINRCIPVGKIRENPIPPPGMSKLVVYLFGGKPIDLVPVDISQDEFIFNAPTLNPNGFLKDVSAGYLWRVLESSHDP